MAFSSSEYGIPCTGGKADVSRARRFLTYKTRKRPGIFPVSPKWRFVLFGLGTIQFARHPEGLVEASKRRSAARAERRAGKRSADAPRESAPAPMVKVKETVA